MTTTVTALEAMEREPTKSSKAVARFDRAMQQLELTSVKTRARAEAIIARGQSYFDEWKDQLAATTNQPAARADTERYARLHDHFDRIRERSGEVRTEFRPFMMKLREFRAALDSPSNAAGRESSASIELLTASGRRVLESLEAVSRSLDEAEVELRATRASSR